MQKLTSYQAKILNLAIHSTCYEKPLCTPILAKLAEDYNYFQLVFGKKFTLYLWERKLIKQALLDYKETVKEILTDSRNNSQYYSKEETLFMEQVHQTVLELLKIKWV